MKQNEISRWALKLFLAVVVFCFLANVVIHGLIIFGGLAHEVAIQKSHKEFQQTLQFWKVFATHETCLFETDDISETCVILVRNELAKFDPTLEVVLGPKVNGIRQLGFYDNPNRPKSKFKSDRSSLEDLVLAGTEVGFSRWSVGILPIPPPYLKTNPNAHYDWRTGKYGNLSSARFLISKKAGKYDVTVFSDAPLFEKTQLSVQDSVKLLIGDYYRTKFLGKVIVKKLSDVKNNALPIAEIHAAFSRQLDDNERSGFYSAIETEPLSLKVTKRTASLYFPEESKFLRSLEKK